MTGSTTKISARIAPLRMVFCFDGLVVSLLMASILNRNKKGEVLLPRLF